MRKINFIFKTIFCVTLFTSCTKTITIAIKDVDKKIVVEAEMSNKPKTCIVKLSKTVDYTTSNTFPAVSNANVTIADNFGNSFLLKESTAGIYTNDTLVGVPNRVYTLNIISEGKNYSSVCTMPKPISIDTITNNSNIVFNQVSKQFQVRYLDDGSVANYYRFYLSRNGNRIGESDVTTDKYNNGINTFIRINGRGYDSLDLATGNVIGVTLQNIDKSVYNYFFSKTQNTNGQSAAPSNPESNITGGALGFFNAYCGDYKTTVMK